ncbi:translocation protein TolB [Maioricimonas rarisocia]|uniref:Translocation protein TolB n=1 Tax=Maioricimonas rarisocia TaxID=2528026 RepID=A0A517Z9D1_9PLAN|nr:PD40 domain-containing protein [Maioricimonas rarisocia]QDU39088.1 translocation protein TolB [Maioricimonas rarisocia]
MTGFRTGVASRTVRRRAGRVSPWILVLAVAGGMGLLFLLPAVIMLLLPQEETSAEWGIARAELPDGTILVLEDVTVGTGHMLEVTVPNQRPPMLPWQGLETQQIRTSTMNEQPVIWLSRRDPETARHLDFDWWLYSVAEDSNGGELEDSNAGLNYIYSSGSGSTSGSRPLSMTRSGITGSSDGILIAHSSLPQIRHEGDSLRLKFYNADDELVAELDVPHVTPPAPVWEPDALPITAEAGDLKVTIAGVSGRVDTWTSDKRVVVRPRVDFDLEFERNGEPAPHWYARSTNLADALGNECGSWDCRLSTGEAAWKVSMQLVRRDEATFAEDEIWELPGLPLPGDDQQHLVGQTETIQGLDVTFEGAGGRGTTSFQGLERSGSGMTYSGSVFGKRFRIENTTAHSSVPARTPPGSGVVKTTVESEFPFVMFNRSTRSNIHNVSLAAVDDQGRSVKTHGPTQVGTLWFWFIQPEEGAQSLDLKVVVQKVRQIEFFVAPPEFPRPRHLRPLPNAELARRLSEATARPLMYASRRTHDVEIMRLDPGSGLTNLTNSPASDSGCAWSPDGSRIAFASDRTGSLELYVMNADGSELVQVTDFAGVDRTPTWSPDGKQLCFTRTIEGNNWELFRINADGTDPVNLTNHPAADADPAWSPDGSRIAFTSTRDGRSYWLYVMDADGSNVQKVSETPSGHVYPAWSPDSRQLVFTGQVDGASELFICDSNGSNERQLTKLGGLNSLAAWSPDDWIAFVHRAEGDLHEQGSIWVIRPDGRDAKEIVPFEAYIGSGAGRPAWHPGP